MTLRHVSRRATVLTSSPRRSEGQSVFHSLHTMPMRLVSCLSRGDVVATLMRASLSALHIHLFDGAGQAISIKRLCQHWRVWHLSVDALHDPIIVGVCRYENYRRAKYFSE